MKKYRILIHGTNFALKDADTRKITKLGFYTTRWVEARDAGSAEDIAIKLIRKELNSLVFNDRSDPPVMYIEKIYELEAFGDHLVPGKGFTWYNENQ